MLRYKNIIAVFASKKTTRQASVDLVTAKKQILLDASSLSTQKHKTKTATKSLKGGGTDNEIVLVILCIFHVFLTSHSHS